MEVKDTQHANVQVNTKAEARTAKVKAKASQKEDTRADARRVVRKPRREVKPEVRKERKLQAEKAREVHAGPVDPRSTTPMTVHRLVKDISARHVHLLTGGLKARVKR